MAYDDYATLTVRLKEGVAFVTIGHPPLNVLDQTLGGDLARFHAEVREDAGVRVIVFESADPDFFIAHGDMRSVLSPDLLEQLAQTEPGTLNPLTTLFEGYRTLPQVTIAKVAGRARGAGNEFLLSLDMRFAARERALFGQPEVHLGMFPGAGGTQYLPRLTGRSRALEVILGSDAFDADLAERYGWINRALPADELDGYVERLALRIASFPTEAVSLAKRSVDSVTLPLQEGLRIEDELIRQVFAGPAVTQRMRAALDAGAQTREGELDLEGLLERHL
ncbi:enoyl-CoA hydratase/isomerase family protein [Streptosporangium sp. CA-135522]|uniref:enoyl-CoA hydratase/isomerase family protein n=1 Tax=Streptosporangium sp. CA-135522 TaxID=3240072 RepID=UPI003D913FB5